MSTGSNPLQPSPEVSTQNLQPLLHEIRHALERLLESGEATLIDLLAMPLSSSEREQLETLLGKGEIECRLNALGNSTIQETASPGIWLVSHFNSQDELIAKSVEITTIPAILPSDNEAIREGLHRLNTLITENA